jgi:hypothetical protein
MGLKSGFEGVTRIINMQRFAAARQAAKHFVIGRHELDYGKIAGQRRGLLDNLSQRDPFRYQKMMD